MRPTIKFLNEDLITKIIDEAYDILIKLGIEIHNKKTIDRLSDYGAKADFTKNKVFFSRDLIEKSLKSSPSSFYLYDINGNRTHNFSGLNVHFTPGSSALNILDYDLKVERKPLIADYIRYVKLVSQLKNITSQSTAFTPSDVPEQISDSIRLYLSFLYCDKPVVTGCFRKESFEVMKNMQVAVRGTEQNLKETPLTIFSVCPTSPLKWSDVTCRNLIDCAEYSIPVEFVSMPLSGFLSPVTIVGTLIQHTAETLSGIVIHQIVNPGAPFLYGGSPAVFDVRYETTPMGAVETMMLDCAYNEIGKYFNLPTQAYISLSDSKQFDFQAGMETSMGAVLAGLSGINNISGPGMLDFENCISLEKLVMDNEICGMIFRMLNGIEPKDDFPSIPLFEELLSESHLLISEHTRKHIKDEIHFPSGVVNRANYPRWKEEGSKTNYELAHRETEYLINNYVESNLNINTKKDVTDIMTIEANKYGIDKLIY